MNIEINEKTIGEAAFCSPMSFLHKSHAQIGVSFLKNIQKECKDGGLKSFLSPSNDVIVFYRHLPWDSDYFGIPTFRIDFLTTRHEKALAIKSISNCLDELTSNLRLLHKRFYIFSEVPAEAICSIQSFCQSKWKMIETRLTYFQESIERYEYPKRFPVRRATIEDIPGLRSTAMKARNRFDRFHADFFFSEDVADNFLATFVENSINGFADITLVPDPDQLLPNAFLTANILPSIAELPETKAARMILSAVDENRRGWYVKLISEMSYIFKEKGVNVAFMTTQSTNRAVIRTWEKLGYSLGKTSHVFTYAVE